MEVTTSASALASRPSAVRTAASATASADRGRLVVLLLLVDEPLVDDLLSGEFLVAEVFLLGPLAGGRVAADLGAALLDLGGGGDDLGLGRADFGAGLLQPGLGLRHGGGGLDDGLLPLGVVDLGQDLAAPDHVADVDDLRPEVSRSLGVQVGRLERVDDPRLAGRPGQAAARGRTTLTPTAPSAFELAGGSPDSAGGSPFASVPEARSAFASPPSSHQPSNPPATRAIGIASSAGSARTPCGVGPRPSGSIPGPRCVRRPRR